MSAKQCWNLCSWNITTCSLKWVEYCFPSLDWRPKTNASHFFVRSLKLSALCYSLPRRRSRTCDKLLRTSVWGAVCITGSHLGWVPKLLFYTHRRWLSRMQSAWSLQSYVKTGDCVQPNAPPPPCPLFRIAYSYTYLYLWQFLTWPGSLHRIKQYFYFYSFWLEKGIK